MRSLLALAAAAAIVAACGTQPAAPEQTSAVVEQRAPKISAPTVESTPVAAVVTPEPVDMTSMAALRNPRSILSKRSVFFDFDQFVIKEEFRPLVEAHAKFLVANEKLKMLVQGNADERGSREYNLALGQKRAEAIKKNLLLIGAKEAQVEAVSLGEEKPRNPGHDAEAWDENRRGDLLYNGEY